MPKVLGTLAKKISDLVTATLPLAGTEWVPVVQGGVTKKVARSDLVTGPDVIKCMASTQANSTVTAAAVTELSATLGVGTWLVKVWVVYRAAATTTGLEMYLRHGGTTTRCAATWYTLTTTSSGAATYTASQGGVADQATSGSATTNQQVMEGKGQRTSNTATGTTTGVDTANSDQFAVLEGIVIVTASGTLDLMFRSEVAASAVTMMEGTTLTANKVA